jgi:predicted MFS family arabinose efflux permease
MTLFAAFRRVVGEREIWKLACVYVMYGFSYIIYLTFFVAYLTKEIGMSSAGAGNIFAIIGIIAIFGGLLWGAFSDVVGRRYACICIYLVLAFAYALPAFFHGAVVFYLSAVMFGIAFSVPVLMAAAAGDAVGGQLAPAALGLITLMFAVAQTLGPFVGGRIKDATGTFTYAFMLCTAFAVAGALFSLLLNRKTQRGELS